MSNLTKQQLGALQQIVTAAVACEKQMKIPKELTTAQCILESGWLKNAPGNNPFGIKCAKRHTECQSLMTTEYVGGHKIEIPQEFAVFPNLATAFADRAFFLTDLKGTYAKVWSQYLKDGDRDTYMQGVAKIYATAPNYYAQLKQILKMSDVEKALIDAGSH